MSPGLQKKEAQCHDCLAGSENAFPSVPLQHLMTAMEELGLRGKVLKAVNNIYKDSSTRLQIGINY